MRSIYLLSIVLVAALATDAEAGKRRKASKKTPKVEKSTQADSAPALAVGSECDLNKELGTRGGELPRIAAGATVRVTHMKADDLTISTAAGTASLKRGDLLAACDKPPHLHPIEPVVAAAH